MDQIPTDPKQMTQHFEGWRDNVYTDTKGNPTIGWGFNLNDDTVKGLLPISVAAGRAPLTREQASPVFDKLYSRAQATAQEFIGSDRFAGLPDKKRAILTDMAYNMGDKLKGFVLFKKAIIDGDDARAKREMKDSDWYKQVGRRSRYLVGQWGGGQAAPQQRSSAPIGFSQAFAQARQQGLPMFTWNGKKYTTEAK